MADVTVAVVGGTGYTGVELLRLLVTHPQVSIRAITSRAEAGRPVSELYPNLRGLLDMPFEAPDLAILKQVDVVFFATPNATAMHMAPALLDAGVRVIDLAADFRFRDAGLWAQWYGQQHACPDLLDQAVYGLPEVNRAALADARLIGCAGCYPTAVQLGLLPLLKAGVVEPDTLIADTKSGVSGAGRGAAVANLLCEASESMKAYAVAGHRHQPEICTQLEAATGQAIGLIFVPHLTPMIRGIHATLYATLSDEAVDLQQLYEQHYQDEACVDVMPAGSHPETRSVRGANMCRLAVHRPGNGRRVVVLSVIDNLTKGAAGQAVQCMNIACGLSERSGLLQPAMLP